MEITYEEYKKALRTIRDYVDQTVKEGYDVMFESQQVLGIKYHLEREVYLIDHPKSTVRIINCLALYLNKKGYELQVKDLIGLSRFSLSKIRNLGRSSMVLIEEICLEAGFDLLP